MGIVKLSYYSDYDNACLFLFYFQARDKLMSQNKSLQKELDESKKQNVILKSHLGMIRKNTIAFILEQMDALNIQRDTEV